ncbi:hypothetical protein PHLGIDRAFT_91504 [Phlebiopsis gigantea 11061_1 CR5-6]|uniref:Thioredoxin domain-containing protein n=1 Tax=Phlebiopsis gigantea (strain 11061_1 CR5-6) TaxID=745531 RepID=A0A0C3NLM7_PHLG1|nr:hypothetical protein PHLGIDRAFT_91504 [Phlebiopsis gigantea 11061_1 CR5-6]
MTSKHLRIGSIAPDFEADTTEGPIKFHEWAGDSWVMFFSHPGDFTPVCTTEVADISHRAPDFKARNVKVIGISVDVLSDHYEWIGDIIDFGNLVRPTYVDFPIIADPKREIAKLYDMIDDDPAALACEDREQYTLRTVFILDPKHVIRATLLYPASVGRDFGEIIRLVDSLQTTDKYKVDTPAGWKKGDDVVIPHSLSDEEARKRFPNYKAHNPYLRTTPLTERVASETSKEDATCSGNGYAASN